MEATGIQLTTEEGKINTIVIYIPPKHDLPEEEITKILDTNEQTIIAGDLNAKHYEWNSKHTNATSVKLKKLADEKLFAVIGPDEDTHLHAQINETDILDICLVKKHDILMGNESKSSIIIRPSTGYVEHTNQDKHSRTNH